MSKKVKLKEIIDFKNGYAFKSNEFKDSGIPIIRIGNISEDKLDLSDLKYYDENSSLDVYQIFNNDILIAMSGATTGKIALNIFSEKLYLNQRIGSIRAKECTIPTYIFYFLKKNKEYLLSLASGSAQPNLSSNQIKDIEIPFPSLEEQKQIAKRLDKANELIELRKESISKLDTLAKSIFIDMFGDPVTNPKGWKKNKISDTYINKGDFVDGPFGSDLKVSDRTDEGIRIIQINNIGINMFRNFNKAYISEKKYLSLKRHEALRGDIVIAKMGEPIARSCFFPEYLDKAIIVADCMRLRVSSQNFNPKFVCFYLNLESIKCLINNLTHGSTRVRINLSILKTLDIINPNLELQNKFAKIIEKIEEQKSLYEKELEILQTNFDALLQKSFQE
ncbi:restriction endonuclease subunit S [Aliarcobacter lanthieri]|uniref:restriction endonuclease subunit S n=1 Tax=Aliarcobacter lanthieri TaxID=1355374 RepID=UPI003AA8A762